MQCWRSNWEIWITLSPRPVIWCTWFRSLLVSIGAAIWFDLPAIHTHQQCTAYQCKYFTWHSHGWTDEASIQLFTYPLLTDCKADANSKVSCGLTCELISFTNPFYRSLGSSSFRAILAAHGLRTSINWSLMWSALSERSGQAAWNEGQATGRACQRAARDASHTVNHLFPWELQQKHYIAVQKGQIKGSPSK